MKYATKLNIINFMIKSQINKIVFRKSFENRKNSKKLSIQKY